MPALAEELARIPLVQDVAQQRKRLAALLARVVVLLLLFTSVDRMAAGFLVRGLKRSYGLDVPSQVLCIGHSHTALGIDRIALEQQLGVPVSKYARNGANIADRLSMIKHYLEEQPTSVKVVVYDVDAHTFTGKGLSLNSYTLFYPFMDSPSVDAYVRQHACYSEYWLRRVLQLPRFDLETCNASLRGWLGVSTNLKRGKVDSDRLKKEIATGAIRRISFDEESLASFEETLRFVSGKGIYIVLLYIPTIDLYNEAEPEQFERAVQLLQYYSTIYDGIAFLNYNPVFSHRHELFYDCMHLNPQGQKLVTEKLAHDLKSILIEWSRHASGYAKDRAHVKELAGAPPGTCQIFARSRRRVVCY